MNNSDIDNYLKIKRIINSNRLRSLSGLARMLFFKIELSYIY